MAMKQAMFLLMCVCILAALTTKGESLTVFSISDLGCWTDSRERDLPNEHYSGGSTLEDCAKHCFNKGYPYAGAQFGNECFCGNNYGRYGRSTNCKVACPGDQTGQTMCGGGYANSVMSTGLESAPTPFTSTLFSMSDLGCWTDTGDRDLPNESYTDTPGGNTLDYCAKHCFNKRYLYAGAQFGYTCFCGNSYGRYGPSTACTVVCPGDQTDQTICGGGYANSVMSTGLDRCEPNLKNMAVYEGQLDIMMNLLTYPQSVTWSVQPSSDESNLQNIIDIGGSKNPSLIDLYDVKETGLFIKKATVTGDPISSAGLYVGKCVNSTDNVGAKLLVIRTGPQCSRISIDTGSSGVSCNITFADSVIHPIRPIVTWSLNGEFLASYTLQMERIIGDVFYAVSTIETNGGANDNYQCEVTFDAPDEIIYPWIATNAPEFKESCSITG